MATLKLKKQGFSLVELAIVLIIIGLFISGLLPFTASQINHRKIVETDEKLEDIKQALIGFAIIHGRLPCPASNSNTGVENCGALSGAEGFLPWADLGIGRQDSWGQPFRYRSDSEYSLNIPNSLKTKKTSNRLKIENKAGSIDLSAEENYSNESTPNNYSRIVAIVFSRGKNLVPENENNDFDNIYILDNYIENKNNPAATFDDRLTWLSKYMLIKHLAVTNTLPP